MLKRTFSLLFSSALLVAYSFGDGQAQSTWSQQKAAALFNSICLKNFPETDAIAENAKRNGLTKISENQWSDERSGAYVLFFPTKKKTGNFKIRLEPLGVSGWDVINIKYSARRTEGACIMLLRTSPENIYRFVAGAVDKTPAARVRTSSGGLGAKLQANVNGHPARIDFAKNKISSELVFTLIKIEKTKK